MKAVILAGGAGTRISEETVVRPKPMIEIGGRPMLWHILKSYSSYGINEFVICLGYKGYMIKEYFSNYILHMSDVTFDMGRNTIEVHRPHHEPWKVTLVDTGLDTLTGGRLKRAREFIGSDDFCMTYGDGLGSVDLRALATFHHSHGKLATVTATLPAGRFGALRLDSKGGNQVTGFEEKPHGDGGYINGGFFVLSPKVLDYVEGDDTAWEQAPMKNLVRDGQIMAFKHDGFWQPMDTGRDKVLLENLWNSGKAPWKSW